MKKLVVFFLLSINAFAQADLSTKQTIESIDVFQDFKHKNRYYYAPTRLMLATSTGKPDFRLIASRYLGTTQTADAGTAKYLNILQFGVLMEELSSETLAKIKRKLGNIDLQPVRIRSIETTIALPVEGIKNKIIGQNGGFDGNEQSSTSFWKERTYTVQLTNQEFDLINQMVEKQSLLLGFNYVFYVEGIKGTSIYKKESKFGTGTFSKIKTEQIKVDTIVNAYPIKIDAFGISIDKSKWGVTKKIDINQNILPMYATLMVKCFDFSDNLRPDLALKTITQWEITSLNDKKILIDDRVTFDAQNPSLNSQTIAFPYAVNLSKPIRYQLTTYNLKGEKESYWKSHDNWAELIDITSPPEPQGINRKQVEIELVPETWDTIQSETVKFIITYFYTQIPKTFEVVFKKGSLNTQKISLAYDKTLPIKLSLETENEDGKKEYEVIEEFDNMKWVINPQKIIH
jgi:hypothetical protein